MAGINYISSKEAAKELGMTVRRAAGLCNEGKPDGALDQIENRHYAAELWDRGVNEIVKYGIAFCGKPADVVMAESLS